MAEIFLATHINSPADDAPVVVKRILPNLAHDERFVAMFLNEAQLAAHMHHPNIVRVLEFGEEDGRLFMVMEFVDGLDCWRFAKRSEHWEDKHVGVAVYIIRQVLDALAYAHNVRDVNGELLQVVHRDLTPSNIYLSRSGNVKLGDFGIARIESTRFRAVQIIPKGKYGYMAPEQVEGRPVDMRADVYSAGVVLTELLIQQQLFTGTSQLSIMLDIRDGRLERLEKNAEKIPDGLRQILEGALARNPADRYRTASEFSEALMVYETTLDKQISQGQFAAKIQQILELGDSQKDITSDIGAIAQTLAGEEILGVQTTKPDGVTAVDAIKIITESDGTPVTMDFEQRTGQGKYWAHITDGTSIGPTAFAHIVELIYSDKISGDTPISKDGRSFSPAKEFEELVRHLPVYTPTSTTEEVNMPKRRGLLEMESPSNILLTLAASNDTGALICELNGRRKEVYIRNGQAVYVGSNESSELLGEYLVENGVVERMELEMALALLPKFHGHLGDTLIALGMLTAVDLFKHISGQITQRLNDLVRWQSGKYEFFEGVEVRQGVLEVQLDLVSFVRDYLLHRADEMDTDEIYQKLEMRSVSPSHMIHQLIDRLRLPHPFDEKFRAVQDWCSVSELAFHPNDTSQVIGKTLFLGIESGLWTCDAPSIPWHTD
ncbi:MAG: serine/threonine protein kinase [Deltaproteobacteria bacterium]|nr:serine/threonine protein kinase [Deltaproteobacteria bacterium]MBN2673434.1 serine/threonine protein kinase [Deltaproteobacteria bacterium]